MTKLQIIGSIVAIIAVVIIGTFWRLGAKPVITDVTDKVELATTSPASGLPVPRNDLAAASDPNNRLVDQVNTNLNRRDPWTVLAQYLDYLKTRNLAGVRSLSHQVSPVCQSGGETTECFKRLDAVYTLGQYLKPDDFPIRWEDAKQLVLLGPIVAANHAETKGYRQGVIIFTKDNAGNLRILYFDPNRSWYASPEPGETAADTEARLRRSMADEDQDLMEDRIEECVGEPADCVATDPTKRDTDGDGWWDGVERFFYQP